MEVNLKPYLRRDLDVLFVALNPSKQSNSNAHYFSGQNSRFFRLLGLSGLTTREVPKATADEIVFGGVSENVIGAAFGVVDLVEGTVDSNSANIRPTADDVSKLVSRIREFEPKFACIIHSKVLSAFNRWAGADSPIDYGYSGRVLLGCATEFMVNYFPNGSNIRDAPKLEIFGELRRRIEGDT